MSRQLRDRDGHAVGCPSENGCDCGYERELLSEIATLREALVKIKMISGPVGYGVSTSVIAIAEQAICATANRP